MKMIKRIIVAVSFFLMSSNALAFTTASGSITLDNINWGLTDAGLPVAPYGARVDIGNTSFQGNLACLDINLTTYVGATYPGVWYSANSYVSNLNHYTALNEVGWLIDHMQGLTPQNANPSVVGPIDLAIWNIMLPYSANPSMAPGTEGSKLFPIDPKTQTWINDAASAVANGYSTTDLFFSPQDKTSQGYALFGPNPVIPTPEPGTMVLLSAGMAGLVIYSKRRKANKG